MKRGKVFTRPWGLCFLAMIVFAPASANECRMPDLQRGLNMRVPPECETQRQARSPETAAKDRLGAKSGFIDLGNGTQVRIGGRVRAEMGIRR